MSLSVKLIASFRRRFVPFTARRRKKNCQQYDWTNYEILLAIRRLLLVSLRRDDDEDGSEKVAKNESASFQTHSCLFNLDPLNSSNVDDFSWSWILEGLYPGSKRERKIRRRIFTSSMKRRGRRFHVLVGQWTWKNVLKSVMHVQSYFCAPKTNCFLTLSLSSYYSTKDGRIKTHDSRI